MPATTPQQPSENLRPGAVTIGIATWNRRTLLQRALESVLGQTHRDLAVVVSDDASTDNTLSYLATIADPRLTVIAKSSNGGIAANYQTCLKASTTEFFLLLNDDDVLLPTAVEKLRHAFLHPPAEIPSASVGVVWCPFTNVNREGTPLWNVRGGPSVEPSVQLIQGLFNGSRGPICSAVMVRTADLLAGGGYEARFESLCEGIAWGKAALQRDYAICVDEPLMRYLVHHASTTTDNTRATNWQSLTRMQVEEYALTARARGDIRGAQLLLDSGNQHLANITASVILRWVGRPGWIADAARELWRSRSFMFTPFVCKRLIRDGWKILHLQLHYASANSTQTALQPLQDTQADGLAQ